MSYKHGSTVFFAAQIYDGWFTENPPGFGWNDQIETDLWAGFFAVEYDLNDQWTGYIEGRYTDFEEKEINGTQIGLTVDGVPGPQAPEFTTIEVDDD